MVKDQEIRPQDALAQLLAFHREIEAQVDDLERAAAELASPAKQVAALATISKVVDFFEGPAALHQADEDEALFPLLHHLDECAQMLGAFKFQHQMNDDSFAKLREAVRDFRPDSAASFATQATRFAEMQRAHILAEERVLFPQATASLTVDALKKLATGMNERRRS